MLLYECPNTWVYPWMKYIIYQYKIWILNIRIGTLDRDEFISSVNIMGGLPRGSGEKFFAWLENSETKPAMVHPNDFLWLEKMYQWENYGTVEEFYKGNTTEAVRKRKIAAAVLTSDMDKLAGYCTTSTDIAMKNQKKKELLAQIRNANRDSRTVFDRKLLYIPPSRESTQAKKLGGPGNELGQLTGLDQITEDDESEDVSDMFRRLVKTMDSKFGGEKECQYYVPKGTSIISSISFLVAKSS